MHRVDSTGATPGGYSDSGNTSIGSPTITNLGATGGINPGDYVEVSAGFPDFGYIRVIAKTVNTITLAINAASTETGVSVTSQANFYTDGLAGVVSRTVLGAKHMNSIQEELCNLVLAAGGSLGSVLNNSLKDLLVRINGGQKMTGDLEMPSHQLTKFAAGAGVTSTKNLQALGGVYLHSSLAVNSEVKLFNYGTTLDEKAIALSVIAKYTHNALERLAAFNIIALTGEDDTPPNNRKRFIIPQDMLLNLTSATAVNLGGLYYNTSSPNPTTVFDGTAEINEKLMFILDKDAAYIRNSHDSQVLTNIEIYLKSFNLLI